ncbi:MAG: hypothetical protein WAS07_05925 [Micropruina sp.]|nr:hypothetical protein [Micropruina sp.]
MNAPSDSRAELLAALVGHLAVNDETPNLEVATMFRSPGIRVSGKIVAFLGANHRLIVKLPRQRALDLIQLGQAEPVTMGSRTMREWVAIPGQPSREETLTCWQPFVQEALAYLVGPDAD